MRRYLALVVAAVAWQAACPIAVAQAQDRDIVCDSFVKNPDGSWTVVEKVFIPVQNVKVIEGTVFRPGETFLGDDMAARLNKACPNVQATIPTPATAGPPQPQTPQVPQVSLSRYADANGNIDVRRLTCGHLNMASNEEANALLSWYGGSYTAAAKNRIINLARVRYVVRSVVDYCKANPEKSLSQVMELMLKLGLSGLCLGLIFRAQRRSKMGGCGGPTIRPATIRPLNASELIIWR
jgi:hypothetical protein